MRTTLTLDDDIGKKIKDLCRLRGESFKAVVNATLRRGLATQELALPRDQPVQVPTFSSPFLPGVDPMKLAALSDELEAEEALARFRSAEAAAAAGDHDDPA